MYLHCFCFFFLLGLSSILFINALLSKILNVFWCFGCFWSCSKCHWVQNNLDWIPLIVRTKKKRFIGIYFYISQNKGRQTGLERRECDDRMLIFEWSIPLNTIIHCDKLSEKKSIMLDKARKLYHSIQECIKVWWFNLPSFVCAVYFNICWCILFLATRKLQTI